MRRFRLKKGLSSNRTKYTPDSGEPIYTTDTKELYIGDGTTPGGNLVGGPVPIGANLGITTSTFGQPVVHGSATTFARSDHSHPLPANPVPASGIAPLPTGSSNVGHWLVINNGGAGNSYTLPSSGIWVGSVAYYATGAGTVNSLFGFGPVAGGYFFPGIPNCFIQGFAWRIS